MGLFTEEIAALQVAESIDGIKFVEAVISDNARGVACKIPNDLGSLDTYSRNQLLQDLNLALAPVLAEWRDKYVGKVRRKVGPYMRDDELNAE